MATFSSGIKVLKKILHIVFRPTLYLLRPLNTLNRPLQTIPTFFRDTL